VALNPYDEFASKAVESFEGAIEEAQRIWPPAIRKEALREWSTTMKALEVLDRRTRAAVLATLLPIVAIGEETDAETALRNTELLFVAILESIANTDKR
jgi:hypothetical protein